MQVVMVALTRCSLVLSTAKPGVCIPLGTLSSRPLTAATEAMVKPDVSQNAFQSLSAHCSPRIPSYPGTSIGKTNTDHGSVWGIQRRTITYKSTTRNAVGHEVPHDRTSDILYEENVAVVPLSWLRLAIELRWRGRCAIPQPSLRVWTVVSWKSPTIDFITEGYLEEIQTSITDGTLNPYTMDDEGLTLLDVSVHFP